MSDQNINQNFSRVTEILYPFSGLSSINPDVLNNAAKRGTLVHKICEGIMSGMGEIGVNDEVRPYVDSFKQWWGDGKEIISMEERFYCDELMITGQSDIIIKEDGKLILVDLKTSYSPSKTWRGQASGYHHLATKHGYDLQDIQFLHLKRTGKPPKIHHFPLDSEFFKSIHAVWKHFYEKKPKKGDK